MMSGSLSAASSLTSLNADANPRCSTHRKGLKFFCCKHELLLCSVCAVKKHRTCDEVLTISEASEDKKTEGKKILEIYNQRITLIENAIVERKAAKKLLDTNAQEILNEIHQVTQRLVDLVKHEERGLILTLQDMQAKESESLESDIHNLEITCNNVRSLHGTLAQNLKLLDIDLIYSVIKEKQQSEERAGIDNVVKKRFREVDFKFVPSPHVTSFLRHFKTLGQVTMSEDMGGGQRSASSMSSSVTDLPPSPLSRRSTEHAQKQTNMKQQNTHRDEGDGSHLSARERWARDRQKQYQPRALYFKTNNNQYTSVMQSTLNQARQIRTLPRPNTPEVFNQKTRNSVPKREFIERPMSTPPMDLSTSVFNQKISDTAESYRSQSTTPSSEITYPVSERDPSHRQHDMSLETHHIHPVHVFQKKDPTEYGLAVENTHVRSPDLTNQPKQPVLAIKEEDESYGRSFAAVQITNTKNDTDRNQLRVRSANDQYSQQGDLNYADNVSNGQPPPYFRALAKMRGNTPGQERSASNNVGLHASDEEKERRWIHRTAFTSNGIGNKRLLCGIGVLSDGRLILVDQEHYTIQLYDKAQRFLTEVKLDSRPYDVAILGEDKIAISLQTDRTIKFFVVGKDTLIPIADLGIPCEMVCYGICRGNGCYCICCGDEIWIMSDEGRVINQIKQDKSGHSLFVQSEYITMDLSKSTMYVSDAGNNKVLAIQIDGRRLWEFTYQGFKPSGIKFQNGYLYICDRDQHRILMISTDGQVVKQSVIGRIENPRALAFNPAGSVLYVTQMRYDAIVCPPRPIQVFTLK